MCAILDANARDEVFGKKQTEAGKDFYEWIRTGSGRLVVGGKLTQELTTSRRFSNLVPKLQEYGYLRKVPDDKVAAEAKRLENRCKSDDAHIIALARVSGARLLYSHERHLHEDFKNPDFLSNPKGKVYPRDPGKKGSDSRKKLLAEKDLCRPTWKPQLIH